MSEQSATKIEEQNQDPSLSSSPESPSSPPVPSIDEDFKREVMGQVGSLANALEEERKRNATLIQELENARREPPPEIDATEFLQQPGVHIKNIVSEQIKEQMAPVHEFIRTVSATTQLQQIKSSLAVKNPKFKEIIENYGDVVDGLLRGAAVNEQTVTQAILYVPGLVATGQVPERKSTPTRPNTVPANVPPSAPPPPKSSPADTKLELTEQERRIQRLLGISDEEYLNARNKGNMEVMKS